MCLCYRVTRDERCAHSAYLVRATSLELGRHSLGVWSRSRLLRVSRFKNEQRPVCYSFLCNGRVTVDEFTNVAALAKVQPIYLK